VGDNERKDGDTTSSTVAAQLGGEYFNRLTVTHTHTKYRKHKNIKIMHAFANSSKTNNKIIVWVKFMQK
jgi:hypothetical protein